MYGPEEKMWDTKFLMALSCPTLILCLVLFAGALITGAQDTGTGDSDYSTRIIQTDGADWACLTSDGQHIVGCERTGETQ